MVATKQKADCAFAPFTVVIDVSEKTPWQFKAVKADADQGCLPLVVTTEVDKLETGDYSIRGIERSICIERKSKADLFRSLSPSDRDRFEGQLSRMQAMDFAAVIVEAPVDEMLSDPPEHLDIKPKEVIRAMMELSLRFPNVHWWAMPSRAFAELWCFRLLRMYWRNKFERSAGGRKRQS